MLESLTINGRTYIPVDAAAAEVGYVASYIERLARGKWIDASFVHDRCFVDIDSLRTFVTSSESDLVIQITNAALREKTETILQLYELRTENLPTASRVWFIVGQVGVITACGLLVGVLSFSAVRAELTAQDFARGLGETAAVLQRQVALPAAVLLHDWFSQKGTQTLEHTQDTPIEAFPGLVDTPKSDLDTVFSDEVRVEGIEQDKMIVRPVYKSGPATEAILF